MGNVNGNALYTLTSGTLTTGASGQLDRRRGDRPRRRGELDNSGGVQPTQSIDGFTLRWDSAGAYKLTGTGSLSVAANENIGVFGAGTFLQGDGKGLTSNTVGGSLYISSGYGGPATAYTLTDGSLTVAGSEIVGFAAQGSFNQSGGANNANGGLTIGLMSPNPGYPTQFGREPTLGGSGALNVGGEWSSEAGPAHRRVRLQRRRGRCGQIGLHGLPPEPGDRRRGRRRVQSGRRRPEPLWRRRHPDDRLTSRQ